MWVTRWPKTSHQPPPSSPVFPRSPAFSVPQHSTQQKNCVIPILPLPLTETATVPLLLSPHLSLLFVKCLHPLIPNCPARLSLLIDRRGVDWERQSAGIVSKVGYFSCYGLLWMAGLMRWTRSWCQSVPRGSRRTRLDTKNIPPQLLEQS